MSKIGIARLKQIIREELSNLNESEDHATASKIAKTASDLLKSLESFKDSSSEKARTELGDSLDRMQSVLDRIVRSPMEYVDATEPGPKVVSLKPEKQEVV